MLDAGCGTGKVTRVLLERLPRGRVIAVDASPSMVEQARAALPGFVDVRQADLTALELGDPVDAVLSTATFHWILDHPKLFANLHAALKPGRPALRPVRRDGQRRGGQGARASRRRPSRRFAEHFAGWPGAWYFAGAGGDGGSASARQASPTCGAGSRACEVDPGDREGYLRAICLGPFLDRLPEALREPFLAAALDRLPDPLVIDYVRLNILARRPAEAF